MRFPCCPRSATRLLGLLVLLGAGLSPTSAAEVATATAGDVALAAGPAWWAVQDQVTDSPAAGTGTIRSSPRAAATGGRCSLREDDAPDSPARAGLITGVALTAERAHWQEDTTALRLTDGTLAAHAGYCWRTRGRGEVVLEPLLGAGIGAWRIATPGAPVQNARTVVETAGLELGVATGVGAQGRLGLLLEAEVVTGRPVLTTTTTSGDQLERHQRVWLSGGSLLATAGWTW